MKKYRVQTQIDKAICVDAVWWDQSVAEGERTKAFRVPGWSDLGGK